jgi:hypothetical protein
VLRFCTVPSASIKGPPTITPLSLIAAGRKLPSLVMVPLLYKNPRSRRVSEHRASDLAVVVTDTAQVNVTARRAVDTEVGDAPSPDRTRWALPLVSPQAPAI